MKKVTWSDVNKGYSNLTSIDSGDIVSIKYKGYILNSKNSETTKNNKNNSKKKLSELLVPLESGRNFTFRLGDREVIDGIEIGMKGMYLGGTRVIEIPSTYAFKAQGLHDKDIKVPANSDLKFEVTVTSVMDTKDAYSYITDSEDDVTPDDDALEFDSAKLIRKPKLKVSTSSTTTLPEDITLKSRTTEETSSPSLSDKEISDKEITEPITTVVVKEEPTQSSSKSSPSTKPPPSTSAKVTARKSLNNKSNTRVANDVIDISTGDDDNVASSSTSSKATASKTTASAVTSSSTTTTTTTTKNKIDNKNDNKRKNPASTDNTDESTTKRIITDWPRRASNVRMRVTSYTRHQITFRFGGMAFTRIRTMKIPKSFSEVTPCIVPTTDVYETSGLEEAVDELSEASPYFMEIDDGSSIELIDTPPNTPPPGSRPVSPLAVPNGTNGPQVR